MTKEEIGQLIQAIKAHPQLFYDVFIDPSFIKATEDHVDESRSFEPMIGENTVSGADESKAREFISDQDEDTLDMWEILIDLRSSPILRIGNDELAPFKEITAVISGFLKAKHIKLEGGGAVLSAIWSPSNNPTLISNDDSESTKQASRDLVEKKYSPSEQVRYLADKLSVLLENSDSVTYELMAPFIEDVINNQCKLLVAYDNYVNYENAEWAQKIAQELSQANPEQPLSLQVEQRLFEHLNNDFSGNITPFPQELEEVFLSCSAELSPKQVIGIVRQALFELCSISASEDLMHADFNLNEMLPKSILYHTQTMLLSVFSKIIHHRYQSILLGQKTLDQLKCEINFIIRNNYQFMASSIISDVMRRYIILRENQSSGMHRAKPPEGLNYKTQEYVEDEQRVAKIVVDRFYEVAEDLFNQIAPNINGVIAIALDSTLNRILIKSISSKFSFRVSPSEAYNQLNQYLILGAVDGITNSTPVYNLWTRKIKAEAKHALAYNFAKCCVANDTGEGVSPKLLARFKSDADEAVNARLRYLTLELLLAPNQYHSGVNPELDRAIRMYDSYIKQVSAEQSSNKQLRIKVEVSDKYLTEMQVRIRKGELSDDDLLKLSQMDTIQRVEICGFMLPQNDTNVMVNAASSSVRRGPSGL